MNKSRRLVGSILLTAFLAFPLGVVASHGFTDVPTTSTFHDDIAAIADVGVTTGCAVGKYCPKDFVTREQMAAFLNRLGALAPGKTPVVNATKLDGLDSTAFVRTPFDTTAYPTCAGSSMQPTDSAYAYATHLNSIYLKSAPGHLRCQFYLPEGATIELFAAAIDDDSTTENAQCTLVRHLRLQATAETIATTPASSLAGSSGLVNLVAPSISKPTVGNSGWVYTTTCSIYGFGNDISVVATTMVLDISGAIDG